MKRRNFVEANETATRVDLEGVWSVDLEQKNRTKPFEIDGAPYGSRTCLFRLKSQAKFNDINVRFDSSCDVRGLKINYLATSRNVIFAQGAEQDPSWAG